MENRFTDEQLEQFKKRLLEMKNAAARELEDFNYMDRNDDIQQLSPHTNHPADAASSQYENEFNLGMEGFAKDQLQDIEDALKKIEDGTYGLSEISGKPIPIERLEALPTARNLVEEEDAEQRKQ